MTVATHTRRMLLWLTLIALALAPFRFAPAASGCHDTATASGAGPDAASHPPASSPCCPQDVPCQTPCEACVIAVAAVMPATGAAPAGTPGTDAAPPDTPFSTRNPPPPLKPPVHLHR